LNDHFSENFSNILKKNIFCVAANTVYHCDWRRLRAQNKCCNNFFCRTAAISPTTQADTTSKKTGNKVPSSVPCEFFRAE
jgi:hypothetical protein